MRYFTPLSSGESVPVNEQHSSKESKNSEAAPVIDTSAPPPEPLPDSEKTRYEELINELYQQLDDKVINTSHTLLEMCIRKCKPHNSALPLSFPLSPQDDEINQHSQLAENLKQQMVDQDEVSPAQYRDEHSCPLIYDVTHVFP